ncbi:unnamed protein product [Vicia faba]|uniref:Retrotransposon gag domain-containing protein n=1 Tax=Vicia faba TaxID=3906 RepID=A0AAV1B7F6_VICFA|nr:unnamed protein product [Vicia faba]
MRIAPTAFDDPRGKLFKLTQSTTVTTYLTEFEVLANRLEGLSDADLLSCFISGLKSNVLHEVVAQQPTSISLAAGLARLQEDKFQDLAHASCSHSSMPWQLSSSARPVIKAPEVTPTA